MAHADTPMNPTDVYPKAPLWTRLVAWAENALDEIAENNPRLQRVESLRAKTDAELAALGIARDEIVHHVFRDAYYR